MMKNKKGFTLIEILAAVTILGILTAVAVVSVTKIIEKAKKEHYVTLENNVTSAAQSYAQQNRAVLPKAIGQKTQIKLRTLTDNKYISEVLDYSKSPCDLDDSYVQIFKYSQKDYSYVPYLECPSYNSKETLAGQSPHITIDFNTEKALGEEKALADIIILGSNPEDVKLMSYNYKIYRTVKGASGAEVSKEVKNSGDKVATGKKRVEIKNMSLEDYTPGKVKIVVTATNIYGMTKTISATEDFKDNKKPECIIKEEDKTTSPKEWIKANRKITVGCDDGEGSGCVRAEYSKTFKTTMKNGKIRITDNSGNYTDCEVSVYIDKTPPTVPTVTMYKWSSNTTMPTSITGLSKYESGWMNKNIYVVPSNSEDNHVGDFIYQYKTDGDTVKYTNKEAANANITEEGTSTIQWRACDSLGNCSEYSTAKTIKLDKTAPTIPQVKMFNWKNNTTRPTKSTGLSDYASDSWTAKSVFTKPTVSNDNLSGVKEYQFTTTGETENKTNSVATYRNIEAEGISYIQWRACDNAGNCSEKSSQQIIKIDKTSPSCGTVSGGSTTWTNNDRTVSIACDESTGSGCEKTSYSKTYNSGTTQTDTITIKDSVGNSRTCSVNAYVDKTAPSCGTISGGSTTWTKSDRTVSVACSDTGGSGCEKNSFSKTYNSGTTTTDTITIKDSVGNSRTCSVNAYVDKTKPSCGTVTGGSTSWTKSNRTISVACSDTGGSGCEKNSFSKTYNSGTTKTDTITIKDSVGNSRTCSVNAYVDKTKPTCGTVSGGSTTWTKSNRTISVACSDTGGSGCEESSYSKKYNSGETKTGTITIEDKVGNSRNCSVNVYVDKVAPTITYIRTITGDVIKDTATLDYHKQSDFKFEDAGSGVKYIYRAHCCVMSGQTYFPNYCISGYTAKQRLNYYITYGKGKCNADDLCDNKIFTNEYSSKSSLTLEMKTTFLASYKMQYAFVAEDTAGNKTTVHDYEY